MSRKMLINATRKDDVRAAIVKDGILEQYEVEEASSALLKGNVYKGTVVNIEPSLNACFVEFGANRHGFLSLDDIAPAAWHEPWSGEGRPRIEEIMRRRKPVVVQVSRDEMGTKGAALTTYVSLAGRYLVLMPHDDVKGISRKITEEKDRKELKETAEKLEVPENCGFIIRTAGIGQTKTALNRDLANLMRAWKRILKQAEGARVPSLLHAEGDLITRMVRDFYQADIDEIIIDDEESFQKADEYWKAHMPRAKSVVVRYEDRVPLFSRYNLDAQIETIHARRVNLPSGGYILIEPTEALISVDVNSGRSTREKSQEDTAFRTNLEAADEVARQLRLRDLGGLVVVDFIDMAASKHNREVEKRLKDALKLDKARTYVGRISENGLCEINRQRLKQALALRTHRDCPTCAGLGRIPSADFVANSIIRRVEARAATGQVTEVRIDLHPELADHIQNTCRHDLVRLEKEFDIHILISGLPGLHRSQENISFKDRPREERGRDERPREEGPREGRDDRGREKDRPRDGRRNDEGGRNEGRRDGRRDGGRRGEGNEGRGGSPGEGQASPPGVLREAAAEGEAEEVLAALEPQDEGAGEEGQEETFAQKTASHLAAAGLLSQERDPEDEDGDEEGGDSSEASGSDADRSLTRSQKRRQRRKRKHGGSEGLPQGIRDAAIGAASSAARRGGEGVDVAPLAAAARDAMLRAAHAMGGPESVGLTLEVGTRLVEEAVRYALSRVKGASIPPETPLPNLRSTPILLDRTDLRSDDLEVVAAGPDPSDEGEGDEEGDEEEEDASPQGDGGGAGEEAPRSGNRRRRRRRRGRGGQRREEGMEIQAGAEGTPPEEAENRSAPREENEGSLERGEPAPGSSERNDNRPRDRRSGNNEPRNDNRPRDGRGGNPPRNDNRPRDGRGGNEPRNDNRSRDGRGGSNEPRNDNRPQDGRGGNQPRNDNRPRDGRSGNNEPRNDNRPRDGRGGNNEPRNDNRPRDGRSGNNEPRNDNRFRDGRGGNNEPRNDNRFRDGRGGNEPRNDNRSQENRNENPPRSDQRPGEEREGGFRHDSPAFSGDRAPPSPSENRPQGQDSRAPNRDEGPQERRDAPVPVTPRENSSPRGERDAGASPEATVPRKTRAPRVPRSKVEGSLDPAAPTGGITPKAPSTRKPRTPRVAAPAEGGEPPVKPRSPRPRKPRSQGDDAPPPLTGASKPDGE